jgi:WD40 repeat protein
MTEMDPARCEGRHCFNGETAMSFRSGALILVCVLITGLLRAQLPPSEKLSEEDNRGFHEELHRLETLLATANDKGAVQLQIAKTYAAGGQYAEAIERLRKLVDAHLGFDPSRDPDFAKIRNTAEFQSILERVRLDTPPVHNSRLITTIDEPDLLPENLAFDPVGKTFFFGSTESGKIVKCPAGEPCTTLAVPASASRSYVLGLKLNSHSTAIWAAINNAAGASLNKYNIHSGELEKTARLEGKHVFNDLALSSKGMVYVTDTAEGSVYALDNRTNAFRRVAPHYTFSAANGIALSPDEQLLYVSAWRDGLDVIDLRSEAVTPISHPDDVSLAFIDGLYAAGQNLIAIQNGPMIPRIVQFKLTGNGRKIATMTVLERRNPTFDGITTGVLANSVFYYVANPQIDKKRKGTLDPLKILALDIAR